MDTKNPEKNTTMENLSKKVLDTIVKEDIKPRARWQFVVKEDLLWFIGALCVLVGAGATSASLFTLDNVGWQFYCVTHDNLFSFLMDSLPIVWIIALIVFISLGYINMRHTKKGYRYPFFVIVLGSVSISLSLGVCLYFAGLGEWFDQKMSMGIPFHRPTVSQLQDLWVKPERGLLGGHIVSIPGNDNAFNFEDFSGKQWLIHTDELIDKDDQILSNSESIRIVGLPVISTSTASLNSINTASATTTDNFYACFIFPWRIDRGLPPDHSGPRPTFPMLRNFVEKIENERSTTDVRTNKCKDVRPYDSLQLIRNGIPQ